MKRSRRLLFSLFLAAACLLQGAWGQGRKPAPASVAVDVESYVLQIQLSPESHEASAAATIGYRVPQPTDKILFELSENLSVQKVLDPAGVELEFGQDETGPGQLIVRFAKPVAAGSRSSLKVEYSGGFDRDRFSRIYSRDETSAYIGPEGSYLLYAAKWYPVASFLSNRARFKVQVTVPLGFTAIGPGKQQPVETKGISEVFTWESPVPVVRGSILAGKYFEKAVQAEGIDVLCFAGEEHLEALARLAGPAAKIARFYEKSFGPSAAGNAIKLVEVDERASRHSGMAGAVFLSAREFAAKAPPVRDLARKIAYQWWMDTIGPAAGDDLWLVDGLAYYSAALYMEASEGIPAMKSEINGLAVLALKFENRSPVRGGLGLGYGTEAYESVVAGKGAWVHHMLREMIGDAKFRQMLRDYASTFAGKGGTTAGYRQLAEKAAGKELGWFLAEWIDSIGVPSFQADYVVFKTPQGFRVSGSIKQDRDLFRMPIEVAVVTSDRTVVNSFELNGKSSPFDMNTNAVPVKVHLDPDGKILRDSPELQTSVQLSLGDDLRARGDMVESIRAYEKALQVNPRKSLVHYRMGEVMYEQANLQSAANAFREALNGDKDPAWIETWCYIYLGKIYDILGQRQRAMAEYTKALNTKDDTFGAQAEAKTWLDKPFTREPSSADKDDKQPE